MQQGGGATGEEQKTQLARLFAQFGVVGDVEVGFMGCAFVTLQNVRVSFSVSSPNMARADRISHAAHAAQEDQAKSAKAALHATTPAISGLARKQGLAVEVATQKGYETALKKAGKPVPASAAGIDHRSQT